LVIAASVFFCKISTGRTNPFAFIALAEIAITAGVFKMPIYFHRLAHRPTPDPETVVGDDSENTLHLPSR